MIWLRRGLLEFWAMAALSVLVGFLGPFGTYSNGDFPSRCWHWWFQLMGAYILVRPSIMLWEAIASVAGLPLRMLVFWGVFVSAFPLALLWKWSADAFFNGLNGFSALLPFAMLSAVGVFGVTVWARRTDEHLRNEFSRGREAAPKSSVPSAASAEVTGSDFSLAERVEGTVSGLDDTLKPRLTHRLSPKFRGPILALQSEDHYVRVHGEQDTEMVLMRLRDAIAEMDGISGQQVHRSWWIAQGAIASVQLEGRRREVKLLNGVSAPVARDSVARLQRSGFFQSTEVKFEKHC